jgi:hypothetical protein
MNASTFLHKFSQSILEDSFNEPTGVLPVILKRREALTGTIQREGENSR